MQTDDIHLRQASLDDWSDVAALLRRCGLPAEDTQGSIDAFHVALVSFLAGGVLALVMVMLRKEARRSAAGVSALLLSLPMLHASGSKAVHTEAQAPKHGGTIQLPYAVAFAAGTLLVKWGAM